MMRTSEKWLNYIIVKFKMRLVSRIKYCFTKLQKKETKQIKIKLRKEINTGRNQFLNSSRSLPKQIRFLIKPED